MSQNRPLVIVTWIDAVQHGEGDTAAKHKGVAMVTIGWKLKYDDRGISLIQEYMKNSTDEWRNENFIPSGMILEVEEITVHDTD